MEAAAVNFGEFKEGMDRLAAAYMKVLKDEQLAHWYTKFKDCRAADFRAATYALEDEDRFPTAGQLKRMIFKKGRNAQMIADSQALMDEGSGWDDHGRAQMSNLMELTAGIGNISTPDMRKTAYAKCVKRQNELFDEHRRKPEIRLIGDLEADHEIVSGYRQYIATRGGTP